VASHLSGVLRTVASYPRAASSNLLVGRGLAGGQGEALDVEFSPLLWSVIEPDADGCLVHANHFLRPAGAPDQALIRPASKSTYVRQARATRLLRQQVGRLAGHGAAAYVGGIGAVLADHFDYPYSICAHPSGLAGEDGGTNLAFVALPSRGEFWLSDGPPCGGGETGACGGGGGTSGACGGGTGAGGGGTEGAAGAGTAAAAAGAGAGTAGTGTAGAAGGAGPGAVWQQYRMPW
jgi:hypothetical protein